MLSRRLLLATTRRPGGTPGAATSWQAASSGGRPRARSSRAGRRTWRLPGPGPGGWCPAKGSGGTARAVVGPGQHLLQGDLKHLGALATQGPGPQPAAVVGGIHTDHLIQLVIVADPNGVTLMRRGGRLTEGVSLWTEGEGSGHGWEMMESCSAARGGWTVRCATKCRDGAGMATNGAREAGVVAPGKPGRERVVPGVGILRIASTLHPVRAVTPADGHSDT